MSKLMIVLLTTLVLFACGGSGSDNQTTASTPDIIEPT